MSCSLTQGFSLDCKDYIGGIKAVMFVEIGNLGALTLTGNAVSGIVATTAFKYELPKGVGSMVETIQSSVENGTIFYENVINIKIHKLTAAKRDEIKLLAQNRLAIFVLDNNNNQWLVGHTYGADLTAGTLTSGVAFGDLNGFDLTFTSQEATPMLSCGTGSSAPFDNLSNLTVSPSF